MRAVRNDKTVPRQHRFALWALGLRLEPAGSHGYGYGYASEAQLADDIGASERTIRRTLAWAREHGWIVQVRRGHRLGNGQKIASEYVLTVPSAQPDTEVRLSGESQPDTSDTQPAVGDRPGVLSIPENYETGAQRLRASRSRDEDETSNDRPERSPYPPWLPEGADENRRSAPGNGARVVNGRVLSPWTRLHADDPDELRRRLIAELAHDP